MTRIRALAFSAGFCGVFAGIAAGQAGSGPPIRPGAAPTDSPARGGAREPAVRPVRTVDLRPKFEKGLTARFAMVVDSTSAASSGTPSTQPQGQPQGQPQNRPKSTPPSTRPGGSPTPGKDEQDTDAMAGLKSRTELGLVLRVTDVSADRIASVDLVIDSLKAKTSVAGQDVEFDSASPANKDDPVDRIMRGIVGTTMTLTVDPSGNITSIKGGEALAGLGGSLTLSPTSAAGGSLPGLPGGKQLFQSIFTVRSGSGEVRIGESWTNEDVIDSGLLGQFRLTNVCTLASVSGSSATITTRGTIKAVSDNPAGSSFQLRDSAFNGRYIWDTSAGMIREMNQTMSIAIDGSVAGQTIAPRTTTTMTLRRTDR